MDRIDAHLQAYLAKDIAAYSRQSSGDARAFSSQIIIPHGSGIVAFDILIPFPNLTLANVPQ